MELRYSAGCRSYVSPTGGLPAAYSSATGQTRRADFGFLAVLRNQTCFVLRVARGTFACELRLRQHFQQFLGVSSALGSCSGTLLKRRPVFTKLLFYAALQGF